ncbi:hypothetical protein RMB12_13960 [Acinetobacter sp. V117_2]|uniref:hypothetical protein n=1 Tax=Acinetobacter TaxID=469 RepID=UPI00287DFD66|nr:hypothetical protein [Acinetobacter sp. V117_2]MDS7968126.1 hypothetical protein [Acinetobacter sp. V117_2]
MKIFKLIITIIVPILISSSIHGDTTIANIDTQSKNDKNIDKTIPNNRSKKLDPGLQKEFTVVNSAGKEVTLISSSGPSSELREKTIVRIKDNCNDIYLFGVSWDPSGNFAFGYPNDKAIIVKREPCN